MKIALADGTGTITLKYVYEDVDRHGTVRIYVKRHKKAQKIRLTAAPGTDEFLTQYRNALNGIAPAQSQAQAAPTKKLSSAEGMKDPASFRWLCSEYFKSADFLTLDLATQRVRRNKLEAICDEEIDGVKTGPLPYRLMEPKHVRQIRDVQLNQPGGANSRLKAMGGMFRWACKEDVGHAQRNPVKDVKRLPPKKLGGWHRWTVDEILQFEAFHALGTQARLAFDLVLYTLVRRSDVVRLGPQMERTITVEIQNEMVQAHVLQFTEYKGRNKQLKHRHIPILPPLRASIDAFNKTRAKAEDNVHALTYLVTEKGKSRSVKAFGNWFKQKCVDAGLSHCSIHGVRKGGATIAAERGASTKELQAMGGWLTLEEPELYTREADQKRLSVQAMHLVEPERKVVESFPPSPGVEKSGEKSVSNPLKRKRR